MIGCEIKINWRALTSWSLKVTVKPRLSEVVAKHRYRFNILKLSASRDYYTSDQFFVVVHGLKSPLGAQGFGETLAGLKAFKLEAPFFVIATENYRVVQLHKNLESYQRNQAVAEPSPLQK